MKYIKNYDSWEAVERNESPSEVSAVFAYEEISHFNGEDMFNINGDQFIYLKDVNYPYNFFINKDNPIKTQRGYLYARQPVEFYYEGSDVETFIKFEQTKEELVHVYIDTGQHIYESDASEGNLILEDGTVLEKVYARHAGDTSIEFLPLDHMDGDDVYLSFSGPWYLDCSYIGEDSINIENYKVTSVTPGIGYCKENRNVMYNDTWKEVTLYMRGGAEKTYKSNYITMEQIINDLEVPSDAYIRRNERERNDFQRIYDGYAFMKSSSGKRYEVTWRE